MILRPNPAIHSRLYRRFNMVKEKVRMRDSGGANMNIHDRERRSLEIAENASG